MEWSCGGYMCVLIIRVMPGTQTGMETWPFPNMALLGHRTIMCKYTCLTCFLKIALRVHLLYRPHRTIHLLKLHLRVVLRLLVLYHPLLIHNRTVHLQQRLLLPMT